MRAIGIGLCLVIVAAAGSAPVAAGGYDDEERRAFARYHDHAWGHRWKRRGPPPWARAHRHGRFGLPIAVADIAPETLPAFEADIECDGEDDVSRAISAALDGALGALVETTFTSAAAQAAIVAVSAAQAQRSVDGCSE